MSTLFLLLMFLAILIVSTLTHIMKSKSPIDMKRNRSTIKPIAVYIVFSPEQMIAQQPISVNPSACFFIPFHCLATEGQKKVSSFYFFIIGIILYIYYT